MTDPLVALIGVKASNLVAGIFGGAVRALLVGNDAFSAFVSVFVGGVTASYLTEPLTRAPINYWMMPEGTVGFLVGLTAMLLCEGILRYARSWSKKPQMPGPQP